VITLGFSKEQIRGHGCPSHLLVLEATVRMIGRAGEATNWRQNLPKFSEKVQNPRRSKGLIHRRGSVPVTARENRHAGARSVGDFLFENFRLDRRGGLFRCNGVDKNEPVAIGSRALDILGVLIERAGEVVTKDATYFAGLRKAGVPEE
jgi:hypothetical protein